MLRGLGYNTINGNKRYREGQQARLRAEVFNRLQDVPINYSCVYRRIEQANQFRKGWDSVTAVDIEVAVKKVKAGRANLLPETALALGVS